MKLTLDHTERLSLHALLCAQRADVDSIARFGKRLVNRSSLVGKEAE